MYYVKCILILFCVLIFQPDWTKYILPAAAALAAAAAVIYLLKKLFGGSKTSKDKDKTTTTCKNTASSTCSSSLNEQIRQQCKDIILRVKVCIFYYLCMSVCKRGVGGMLKFIIIIIINLHFV